MKNARTLSLGVCLALCLVAIAALFLESVPGVHADGSPRYVAPGSACGDASPCYATIQAAVDAAIDDDIIKVATGRYTDTHNNPAPTGYPGAPPGGLDQVVYVDKAITIRGGYLPSNGYADPPNPVAYPTILDAERRGRAILVAGAATLEGLQLRGGDASGLGGIEDIDGGGGLYVINASATVRSCQITDNKADRGGGVFLYENSSLLDGNTISENDARETGSSRDGGGGVYVHRSDQALLRGNSVFSNTTDAHAGGVYLYISDSKLDGNTIYGNRSIWGGAGVYVHYGVSATLSANWIHDNETTGGYDGGGVYLHYNDAVVHGNTIVGNLASRDGGGLTLGGCDGAVLSNNLISANTAGRSGGGIYLRWSDATLDNNVIADNRASGEGSGAGVHAYDSSPRFRHTTIARNRGGDGSGLCVVAGPSSVWLTNTILFSHTVGITVQAGSAAMLEATLWYANGATTGGAGTIVPGTVNVADDPIFAADGYHLTKRSGAINRGIDVGIWEDIDGDPRGVIRDIGADEYLWRVYVPLQIRDAP